MKAEDLMIGDWFIPYGKTKPDRIHSISYKDEPSGRYAICSFEHNPHIWEYPHLIKPIPLTPEILEKNGWWRQCLDKYIQDWVLWCDEFIVSVELQNGYTRIRKHLPILNNVYLHSVHELQHALRLCGINKEIIL